MSPYPKKFYPVMTAEEYDKARRRFGMAGVEFANLIGVGWRQEQRYANGESIIPDAVAKLIRTAVRHKLEPEEIG